MNLLERYFKVVGRKNFNEQRKGIRSARPMINYSGNFFANYFNKYIRPILRGEQNAN